MTTALPLRTLADRTAPFFFDGSNWAGLPFERERNNRVRSMYSLRQDASAVNRVKYRLSDTNCSDRCEAATRLPISLLLGPGK